MKIVITSLYLPSGSKIGVGYQVHYFANQMIKRGHEVTVYSSCGPSPDANYRVEVIPLSGAFRTFRFAWALRKVDFTLFDVLHAHGDDWFLLGVKRPWHIHTYHGSCLAEFLHSRGVRSRVRMFLLAICEQFSLLLCDVSVAVSENTKCFLYGIQHVIPNGLSLDVFTPTEGKADIPVVLFVGTLKGRKRGEFLVRKFLSEVRVVEPKAELWMVCEESVEGAGIRWFGRISLTQLADLYRRAWIFCLPSTYEGFGIPYIEAMASGTAVVASPNRGAREVTGDGRYGLLAADPLLSISLLSMIRNGDLRRRFEENGVSRARDFDWETICLGYEKLYKPHLLGVMERTTIVEVNN